MLNVQPLYPICKKCRKPCLWISNLHSLTQSRNAILQGLSSKSATGPHRADRYSVPYRAPCPDLLHKFVCRTQNDQILSFYFYFPFFIYHLPSFPHTRQRENSTLWFRIQRERVPRTEVTRTGTNFTESMNYGRSLFGFTFR